MAGRHGVGAWTRLVERDARTCAIAESSCGERNGQDTAKSTARSRRLYFARATPERALSAK